jgi:hypothetical protein
MHTCTRHVQNMKSPYAYGDQDQSLYAYRDQVNPRMHTGIAYHAIPVCIQGSKSIPVCIWRSPYAYGDRMTRNPCMRIRGFMRSPYAYGDISVTNRLHTGNISIWEIKSCFPICVISHTGIAVCIWGSPYVQGLLKSSHMEIAGIRMMKLCTYRD